MPIRHLAFRNACTAGRRTRVDPPKQPMQARLRETVRAIVEAAAHAFEVLGPEAVTTDAIAARAGVSIGSLYQDFPSKDALLATLSACHLLVGRAALRRVATLDRREAERIRKIERYSSWTRRYWVEPEESGGRDSAQCAAAAAGGSA